MNVFPSTPSDTGDDNCRQRLLTVAKTLFAEKGFNVVTVRDICTTAGVNVSLVSYHFGGKEGLYRACLASFGQDRFVRAGRLLEVADTAETFILRFQLFLEDLFTHFVDEPAVAWMIIREIDAQSPFGAEIFSTFSAVIDRIEFFIAYGQEKGIIDHCINPKMIAHLLIGAVAQVFRSTSQGIGFFSFDLLADPASRKTIIDQLIRMSIYGILDNSQKEPGR